MSVKGPISRSECGRRGAAVTNSRLRWARIVNMPRWVLVYLRRLEHARLANRV